MSETTSIDGISVRNIEVSAEGLNAEQAASIYREHGCLVVRGLMTRYVERMAEQIAFVIEESMALFDQAQRSKDGWLTPNGALLIPAPENFNRDKQLMLLPIHYRNSSSFMQSALDEKTLDIVEAVLGPNVELFGEGQSLVKEPVGGFPKHLHQDAAYFEHKYEGPMAQLTYVVNSDLQNGCLHVVPGSHKLGVLRHEDTSSHLGLSNDEWPWERALPVEGKAGDAIFFHVNCIHGSKPNYSDAPRPVFIHRYRRADDYQVISASSVSDRADLDSQEAQARKDNQIGFMVRGFRSYDPER